MNKSLKIEKLQPFKFTLLALFVMISLLSLSCSDSGSNPLQSVSSPDGGGPVDEGDENSAFGKGFGVSGLLFENNLVMWFRDNNGQRTELFSQMYFTRLDEPNFPVHGDFPDNFLVSGGVPKDGIPALVQPASVPLNSAQADYIRDNDLVLGVFHNGEAKAYPENILWWHEIVNDVVGGEKFVISLCPLTGSGLNLKYPEALANSIGQLELQPVIETTWKKWKSLFPNSTVVSANTGFSRDYQRYPYGNYRNESTQPLFALHTGSLNGQFPPKHTVLGIFADGKQKAYPFSSLENQPVVNDVFNGKEVLILSQMNEKLAIPYERRHNGDILNFKQISEQPFLIRDDETGTTWNILGEALEGPLTGQRLNQMAAYNAFWFAWAIFWPQTAVFEG